MEPAVYRREHPFNPPALQIGGMSQWSPPFIGGSTRGDRRLLVQDDVVAMEPAVYRREHPVQPRHQIRGQVVAMEPAVYRREHARRTMADNPAVYESQWSPPFIGGSTHPPGHLRPADDWSQWSPPFIGGSTGLPGVPAAHGEDVAMEPAVYRREHGSSSPYTTASYRVAMEPAVYRREHGRSLGPYQCSRSPSQWSPPFIGGSTCPASRPGASPPCRNGARRL